MSQANEILNNVDVNQIASVLGADPGEVESAAQTAVNSLLAGMQRNTGDEQGAVAFANALGQHTASPAALGGLDLNAVDLNDGAGIVNHVLPADQQRQLFDGRQGDLVQKLLPILAPIVMAYLAKRLTEQGGLGSILGGALGGQAQQGHAGMGGGLGDVLGQILGGSQAGSPTTTTPGRVPSGGGLGDILGQILGGGQGQDASYGHASPQQQYPQQSTGSVFGGAPAGDSVPGSMQDPGLGNGTMGQGSAGNTGGFGGGQQQSASVGSVLSNILFGR